MDRRLTRELDQTTAQAVAIMTLYVTAMPEDDRIATALLDDYLTEGRGVWPTIGGFESLCAVLLALLELETGVPPTSVLQRVGVMVASAELTS
ncbi:MAG TPA: hypothetical protein VLL25_06740 [Acidimicrobiales bacterium]|nr:hypothetical protein [Acidimicrobiales bacterium]